ncbi:excalibur calcium-binding domain-containing protein [Propionibacterium freudenreichii]|uniref:excalibur calcium-binding domain-containing protein n=1 Tax=Propionibacterium freudenreichii TaxID=1744 RepID=UPI003D70EF48
MPHRNKNNPRKCLNNSRRIRHQHRYNNNLLPITRTAPRCALQEQPPLHRGQPGYSSNLDKDGDGVACE